MFESEESTNSDTDLGQTQNHISNSKQTVICENNLQSVADLQHIQKCDVPNVRKVHYWETEMYDSGESENSITDLGQTQNYLSDSKQTSICDKNTQILTDLQQIQNFDVTDFQRTDIQNFDVTDFQRTDICHNDFREDPTKLQQNLECLDDLHSVQNFKVSKVNQDPCVDLKSTQSSISNLCPKQHDLNSEIYEKNCNFSIYPSEKMKQSDLHSEILTNVKEIKVQNINNSNEFNMSESKATKYVSDKNLQILTDLQQIQNSSVSNIQRTEICHTDIHPHNSPTILQLSRDCLNDLPSEGNFNTYTDGSADLQSTQSCITNSAQELHDLSTESEVCDENSDSKPPLVENEKLSEPYFENLSNVNKKCDQGINASSEFNMTVSKETLSFSDVLSDLNSHDSKRIRRNSKRKRDLEESCPVCGLTVRNSELESHFAKEIENLSNVAKNIRKPREKKRDGANITFVQVKCNRENRLAAKVAKYSKKNEIQCPVCKVKITGSESEINEHVLTCAEDDDSDINILDHEDEFEEYEFGNETRVRAISFVPGGYRSLHGQSSKNKCEDVDDDLNVDVDDTSSYGKPQELDIIHNKANGTEDEDLEKLRRAVVYDPNAEPHVIEGRKWSEDCEITNEVAQILSSGKEDSSKSSIDEDKSSTDENIKKVESDIISSLKEKIRDLEQQKNVKCLICLEPYTKPVVATTCWHVHCEECWLVTMGVKKLCPQCNSIVFPTNLRRIYL